MTDTPKQPIPSVDGEVVAYGIETYFVDRRAEFERHGATVYHAPMGMATLALVRKSALDAVNQKREAAELERDKAREYGGQARLRERDAEDARVHLSLELTLLKSALDEANARADAAEREIAEFIVGTDKLFAAQNGIVNEVWTLLGGQADTRPGGCNLVGRVREFVARAEAAESQLAKVIEVLRPFAESSVDRTGSSLEMGRRAVPAFNRARAVLAEISRDEVK